MKRLKHVQSESPTNGPRVIDSALPIIITTIMLSGFIAHLIRPIIEY